MSETVKRGRGRPPKPASERKRQNLTMRLRDATKARLEQEAATNHRSLSEEAEVRIERSFAGEQSLPELMALKFGPRLAALLIMIGDTSRITGLIINGLTNSEPSEPHEGWTDHPYSYECVGMAVNMLWQAARPTGASSAGDVDEETRKRAEALVSKLVGDTIFWVKNPEKGWSLFDMPKIHELAGPIADRLRFEPMGYPRADRETVKSDLALAIENHERRERQHAEAEKAKMERRVAAEREQKRQSSREDDNG